MERSAAANAMQQVRSARRSASALRAYRQTATPVIAWGIAWFVGFAATQSVPQWSGWVWLACWAGALAWTLSRPLAESSTPATLTWLAALAFVTLLLVMIGADTRTAGLVFALAVGAAYTFLGIWVGRRFLLLAALVTASACAGWWLIPQWLFLALSLGGGLALVLGGLWLRRA